MNYYRDEVNNGVNENNDSGNYSINNNAITSKSLDYETKIIGSTPNE